MSNRDKSAGPSKRSSAKKSKRTIRDVAPKALTPSEAGPIRGGAVNVTSSAKMTVKFRPEFTRHK